MKALWVRVDADEINGERVGKLAERLELRPVHALGHLTALSGKIALKRPDGNLDGVSDFLIEQWGAWEGPRGAFARAVIEELCDPQRVLHDWIETMGKLVRIREKDRDRKRDTQADPPPEPPPRPPEIPRNLHGKQPDFHGDSTENLGIPPRARANGTVRNGTVRDGTPDSVVPAEANVRGGPPDPSPKPARGASHGGHSATARLIAELEELPEPAKEFLATFYGKADATPRRRRDVARQVVATLHDGAQIEKGQLVRAISTARLAAKCRTVVRDGVRDRDKAIVVLLRALGDTTDVSTQRQEQYQQQALDDYRENQRTQATAYQWLSTLDAETQQVLGAEIDEQLGALGLGAESRAKDRDPDLQKLDEVTCRLMRPSLVVQAWRKAGSPTLTGATP